jgi:hypothetical protein
MKRLEKMHNYINRRLFNSKLDMPYLQYLNNADMFRLWPVPFDGLYIGNQGDSQVFIGIHKDLTKTEQFDTLVHEMIHQYLIEKSDYEGHGKPFKKMCRKAIEEFYWRML